jgi:hypothetical protein
VMRGFSKLHVMALTGLRKLCPFGKKKSVRKDRSGLKVNISLNGENKFAERRIRLIRISRGD